MIQCHHCAEFPMALSYWILITLEIMILLTILKAMMLSVIELLQYARPFSTCIIHLIFTTTL